MALTPINIPVQSEQGRDGAINPARLINCFAETAGAGAKARVIVTACDGYASFGTAAAGQVRGAINLDDDALYVVTGTTLQSVATGGGVTSLASLATSGWAYMARNRRGSDGLGGNPQVAVVTSDGLFRVIEAGVVSTPTLDSEIPSSLFNSVCALDGYFVITLSNGEFYITAIDSGTDIDALDFASAQSNPDGLTRGVVRGRELCLFGPRSCEFWQNTGATDFPFERSQAVEFGAYCPAGVVPTLATIDAALTDTVIWPASNRDGAFVGVMMLAGYDARRISTGEVDRLIRAEAAPADTVSAFAYTNGDGATFYCIRGSTWAYEYNLRTGLWHERQTDGGRWAIGNATEFAGKTILMHATSGALYQRSRTQTPGSASAVTFRHSVDHGDTWTTLRSTTIGTSVARTARARFNRLGWMPEDGAIFEVAITNAIVEGAALQPMTMVVPAVHAWPNRTRVHAAFVDFVPGGSASSRVKSILGLAVDVKGLAA